MKLFAICFIGLMCALPAHAADPKTMETGNDLMAGFDACHNLNNAPNGGYDGWQDDAIQCVMLTSFIDGVSQTAVFFCHLTTCNFHIPDHVVRTQVWAVVKTYLKDHPADWDRPAEVLVMLAFDGAWKTK